MKIILESEDDEKWYWKYLEILPDESKTVFYKKPKVR